MSELLFDDIFKVEDIDPDGKKYDKVSRIVAQSEKRDMYMLLDVNTEIYPMNKNERFLMALSPSLFLNTKDGPVSIQDKFEYIMNGRLYSITNDGSSKPGLEVYAEISHGGICIFWWAADDAERTCFPLCKVCSRSKIVSAIEED